MDRAAEEPVGERGGAVAGVEDEQRRRCDPVPGDAQAAQHVLHLGDRLRFRVAGTVRATSARTAHAVRRCPIAAVS